jgi:hypothetical protein
MEVRFIEPTFEGRVKIGLILGTGIAISLAMRIWWHPFMDYVSSLPFCEHLIWLRGIILAFAFLSMLTGCLSARAAILTLRSGQSPFPGAWVWSRTQIVTGWKAKLNGCLYCLQSAFLLVGPLIGIYYARIIFVSPCQ